MPQKDTPGDEPDSEYNRRTILTGAGSASLGGLLASTGLVSADDGREPGPKEDEILIGVSPSVTDIENEVGPLLPGDAGIEHANETIHYAVVSLPPETPEMARDTLIETLENIDLIEYAEANATLEAFATPNDPHYGAQHAPQQINCDAAWETTLGDEGVVISIVDQGIQYDHPDLAANMDDSVSNHGAVFTGRGSDPYPVAGDEQHGTHVGGIAGGATNNGTGHAGISNCSLLSARALDRSGRGSLSDIADAVQWSVDAGADIINLSLGASSSYRTLRSACRYAVDNDVLLVGAAGNSGAHGVAYPAAYDEVLAVSALTSSNSLASFSNYGSAIDLAAPGSRIVSTVPWNSYGRMSGTSMAAPVVSGVAGLVLSAYPGLSANELREHLQSTAVDVGLSSRAQGYGRVDAGEAVNTAPAGYEAPDSGDGDEGSDDEDADVEGRLLAFVTDPEAQYAEYEFAADGPVEPAEADYESPSGGSIGANGNDTIEESDGTYRVTGLTGGGYGDAFDVQGAVTSIDIDQPDVMWVELDGERMSVDEVIEETGGSPDETDETNEPDDEEGDEPVCGDESTTASADGELSGNWWGDSDRYTYSLRTANPCSATVSLEASGDADFALYVTTDGSSPSRWSHDESVSGSGELTLGLEGDETLGLQVHASNGSGTYTLTVEERGR